MYKFSRILYLLVTLFLHLAHAESPDYGMYNNGIQELLRIHERVTAHEDYKEFDSFNNIMTGQSKFKLVEHDKQPNANVYENLKSRDHAYALMAGLALRYGDYLRQEMHEDTLKTFMDTKYKGGEEFQKHILYYKNFVEIGYQSRRFGMSIDNFLNKGSPYYKNNYIPYAKQYFNNYEKLINQRQAAKKALVKKLNQQARQGGFQALAFLPDEVTAGILEKLNATDLMKFALASKCNFSLTKWFADEYQVLALNTPVEERQHLMSLNWPEVKFRNNLDRLCYNILVQRAVENLFQGAKILAICSCGSPFSLNEEGVDNTKARGYFGMDSCDFNEFFKPANDAKQCLQWFFKKLAVDPKGAKHGAKRSENHYDFKNYLYENRINYDDFTYNYPRYSIPIKLIDGLLKYYFYLVKRSLVEHVKHINYEDTLSKFRKQYMDTDIETGRVELTYISKFIGELLKGWENAAINRIKTNKYIYMSKSLPRSFGKALVFYGKDLPDNIVKKDVIIIKDLPDDLKEIGLAFVVLNSSKDLPDDYRDKVFEALRVANHIRLYPDSEQLAITFSDNLVWAKKISDWSINYHIFDGYFHKKINLTKYTCERGIEKIEKYKFKDEFEKKKMRKVTKKAFHKMTHESFGASFFDCVWQVVKASQILELPKNKLQPYIDRVLKHLKSQAGSVSFLARCVHDDYDDKAKSAVQIYEKATSEAGYNLDEEDKIDAADFYVYARDIERGFQLLEEGLNDPEYKPYKNNFYEVTAAALHWHYGNRDRAIEYIDRLKKRDPVPFTLKQFKSLEFYIKNPKSQEFWKKIKAIRQQQEVKNRYEGALFIYAQALYEVRGELKKATDLSGSIKKWYFQP